LLNLAREFGADAAVIDSGTIPYWTMSAFRKAGMMVIPVFHNCLHPAKGSSGIQKLSVYLAKRALKKTHPIFVSPEAKRQVGHGLEIRAQFRREYFENVSPASFASPFNVLSVGRIDASKGVFDIVEAARLCGSEVSWTICGSGADLDKMREASRGLPIDVRGWTSPEAQIPLRSRCQAVIVPSRSDLNEGMAMSAVEAILSGRPLITNRAVPALEVLRPAAIEAEPDNPRSYADVALSLARDPLRWRTLVDACRQLEEPFYNRRHSLTAALEEILLPISSYLPPS
jgi:glycosyltransferase involved in cell wall biosynthesis